MRANRPIAFCDANKSKPAPGCRAARSTRESRPGRSRRQYPWARVRSVGSRTMCSAGFPTGSMPVGAARRRMARATASGRSKAGMTVALCRRVGDQPSSFDPKSHSGRTHECKQRRQAGIAGPAQCAIQRLARQSGRRRNAGDPPAGLGDGSKRVHDVAFVTTRKCFIEQRCDVRVVGEVFAQEVRVRPTACRSAWRNPPSTASHF